MNEITIPLRYLQAVRLFAPKQDVHPYLLGVSLRDGLLAATDGTCAAAIRLPQKCGPFKPIIVPAETIDFYAKKAGRSSVTDVTVCWDDERKGYLTNGAATEHFVGLDHPYPDIARVVPSLREPAGHPQFQWSLLALFEKAAIALGVPKNAVPKAVLVANGDEGTARVLIPGHPDFVGAISPIRYQHIKPAIDEALVREMV